MDKDWARWTYTTHPSSRDLHGSRQSGVVVQQRPPTARRAQQTEEEVRSSENLCVYEGTGSSRENCGIFPLSSLQVS